MVGSAKPMTTFTGFVTAPTTVRICSSVRRPGA